MNKSEISATLITLRGEKSREDVAKALGISVSTLQMYENGQRIPKDEIKIRIANFYNKTVGDIFFS